MPDFMTVDDDDESRPDGFHMIAFRDEQSRIFSKPDT
jgi:hypothetical protein